MRPGSSCGLAVHAAWQFMRPGVVRRGVFPGRAQLEVCMPAQRREGVKRRDVAEIPRLARDRRYAPIGSPEFTENGPSTARAQAPSAQSGSRVL
ncbi:MAG: hypothetical protein ACI9U2_004408 [Bradymonadia bacterium]|jgi:hypothetical protein